MFEKESPAPEQHQVLLERQSHLLEQMEHQGGWSYQNLIETALSQLSFDESRRHKPIHQLSGGWRNRAALARDSPRIARPAAHGRTDRIFLTLRESPGSKKWFAQHKGGLIRVSHDRHFIDKVVTRIVEIENHHTHEYPVANFGDYIRQQQPGPA